MHQNTPAPQTWRLLALAILLIGLSGTATELGLLGHYEDRYQWTPLILLSLGIVAVIVVMVRPSRFNLRWFQSDHGQLSAGRCGRTVFSHQVECGVRT